MKAAFPSSISLPSFGVWIFVQLCFRLPPLLLSSSADRAIFLRQTLSEIGKHPTPTSKRHLSLDVLFVTVLLTPQSSFQ